MRKVYHDRQFLNDDEGMAAIEASVRVADDYPYVGAEVCISDCSRNVTLDFAVHALEQYDARLEKIDRVLNALTEMRYWMVRARVDFNAAWVKMKEEEAAKGAQCKGYPADVD